MEYLPFQEFQRLPARDLSGPEFNITNFKIQAISYEIQLLNQLEPDVLTAYEDLLRDLPANKLKIEVLDKAQPQEVITNYLAFTDLIDEPMRIHPDDEKSYLQNIIVKFAPSLSLKGKDAEPKPLLGEYLLMIQNLSEDTSLSKEVLTLMSPFIFNQMKNSNFSNDVLSEIDINERLSKLKVGVIDPLSFALYAKKRGDDLRTSGFYNNNFIGLLSRRPQISGTFVHELFHALSGKTVLSHSVNGSEHDQMHAFMSGDEEPLIRDIYEQRTGLRYLTKQLAYRPDFIGYGRPKGKFVWLNEAVTSVLETEFCRSNDISTNSSYSLERKLLRQIIDYSENTELEDFMDAYFEDYIPGDKVKIPAWKTLNEKLTASYGPNFLLKVSKIFELQGFVAAIGFVKESSLDDTEPERERNATYKLIDAIYSETNMGCGQ